MVIKLFFENIWFCNSDEFLLQEHNLSFENKFEFFFPQIKSCKLVMICHMEIILKKRKEKPTNQPN
jgi:hypothetical protein